jgi:1-phosphofructokinase family hexose kinase
VTLNPAVDRELTVPQIEFDRVLRASAWQVDFGGKGFNVSRMLLSLEAESVALAFAGGKSGALLHDGLREMGIGVDFVWVEGETRTNVSIVTEQHDHYVKVNEPGPTVGAQAQETLLQRVHELAQEGDWWVLAGSLPPGVAPEFYGELVTIVQRAGGRAVLDSSGAALHAGCAASPYLIKPNDVELGQLTGQATETTGQTVAAAQRLAEQGLPRAIISMGKAGALVVDEGESWLLSPPVIVERNPIGAGDSLVAGVVYALDQGHSLCDAARWGVACGAATDSLSRTAVGSGELVRQLLTQVGVQAMRADAPYANTE